MKRARPHLPPARGFSLVELMVAMMLSLLLVAAAASLFLVTKQVSQEQERVGRLKENLRFAADFMARDIRAAGLTETGGVDFVSGVEPGNPGHGDQTSFTVRKAGMNCLGDTGAWVASTYSVQGRTLRCGNDASPPQVQPLVNDVIGLSVVALDAHGHSDWDHPVALRIELEFETRSGAQVLTRTLEFVVSLRNGVLLRNPAG